jgi:hypothetical protein
MTLRQTSVGAPLAIVLGLAAVQDYFKVMQGCAHAAHIPLEQEQAGS